jgi:hypothetical protein
MISYCDGCLKQKSIQKRLNRHSSYFRKIIRLEFCKSCQHKLEFITTYKLQPKTAI